MTNPSDNRKATITPASSDFLDVLFYAPARFSDLLRRMTDFKNAGAARKLKMNPTVGLWLTLALIGVVISANSYFVGFQELNNVDGLTTIIPLGRDDVAFAPMALFPPVLMWLAAVVNFASWLMGLIIPDLSQLAASPAWTPTPRPTVWSNATLALAWWVGFGGSVLISSTQGLFTRSVPLGKQREYAERLNRIARIELNPKAIAPAKREVAKANNYGRSVVWLLCLMAVGGWAWELFVANGALDGSTFDTQARWIYGLASTFMAELCWLVADQSGKKIDPNI